MSGDKLQKPLLMLFILSFCLVGIIIGVNVPFAYFALGVLLSYLLAFRINLSGFPVILFVLAFLIRFIYILIIDTPPDSDFKLLFDAAISFSKDDYSFNQYRYFQDWAYQTGFVIYEGLVIKLVGAENALFILKTFNALFGSATCLLIWLIARNFVSEKTARFTAVLSVWAVFPVAYVTVLSNQHQSTFFLILGLFVIADKHCLKLGGIIRGLLSGLFLALGNIFRPEGIIVLSALFLYLLIRILRPLKENRKSLVVKTALMLVIYFGANVLASELIITSGINKEGLRNNNPLWKFVAGLNIEGRGTMSEEDAQIVYASHIKSSQERRSVQLSLIKERLSRGPKALISLLLAKQHVLWGYDPMIWSYSHLLHSGKTVKILLYNVSVDKLIGLMTHVHSLQMFVIVMLSLFGAVYHFKGNKNQEITILYSILLITFAIYSLIEVQPRYIHLQQAILFITAGAGIERIIESMTQRIKSA